MSSGASRDYFTRPGEKMYNRLKSGESISQDARNSQLTQLNYDGGPFDSLPYGDYRSTSPP